MLAASFIAFGHFVAVFALLVSLVIELVLLTESMTRETVSRIQRADMIYGFSAMMLLLFGMLRVIYFEKGSDYYFSNSFFQIKLGLFICLGILSVYPTVQFLRWRKDLKQGKTPVLSGAEVKRLKQVIHSELVLFGAILLCASLMAKGLGS
jgi:putative membrane protein